MKKVLTLSVLCLVVAIANAQLIKNDFLTGYTVGDVLEKGAYENTTQGEVNPIKINQWNLSGKTGDNDQSPESANPKTVPALAYEGYAESGKDVAIQLLKLEKGGRTDVYSLANDNTYGAGTYYAAFMFNVATATTSGNEFFSFDGNYTGNSQRGRFTIKGIDENKYQIGLGDAGAASTFVSGSYDFNKTYLAVIKLTIDGEGTGQASLYINPTLDSEPTTALTTTQITGTALKSVRGFTIRQRSTLEVQVGGFRFAKSWADVTGGKIDNIGAVNTHESVLTANGKTIVSNQAGMVKVYSLTGAEILKSTTNGNLETNLTTGIYVAQFTNEAGTTSTVKIAIK